MIQFPSGSGNSWADERSTVVSGEAIFSMLHVSPRWWLQLSRWRPPTSFAWAHFCSLAHLPGRPPLVTLLPKAVLSREQEMEGEQSLFPLQQQCVPSGALASPSACAHLGRLLDRGHHKHLLVNTGYLLEVWPSPPMAMTVRQGHHTLASNCPASEDEWKTEFRIWMVGVGWSHCLLGKNVGCVQVVDYLQEETNVNGNALTYLLIHERAVLFCWGPLSMWSHFCHCEQRKGMASFWYSRALHTRVDTLGPRIPTKYPDKTSSLTALWSCQAAHRWPTMTPE